MGKKTGGGGRRVTSARVSDAPNTTATVREISRGIDAAFSAQRPFPGNWEKKKETDFRGYQRRTIEATFPDGSTASVALFNITTYGKANRLRIPGETRQTYEVRLYVSAPGQQVEASRLYAVTAKGESGDASGRTRKTFDSVVKRIKKTFGVDVTSLDFNI